MSSYKELLEKKKKGLGNTTKLSTTTINAEKPKTNNVDSSKKTGISTNTADAGSSKPNSYKELLENKKRRLGMPTQSAAQPSVSIDSQRRRAALMIDLEESRRAESDAIRAFEGTGNNNEDIRQLGQIASEAAARRKSIEDQLKELDFQDKYTTKTYGDNFFGQTAASFRAGQLNEKSSQAWDNYWQDPSEDNRRKKDAIDYALQQFQTNNEETLADDATLPWVSQSLAGYLPQFGNQMKYTIGGGLAGAVAGGTAGSVVPVLGTAVGAWEGAKLGASAGTGVYSFQSMRGAAFRELVNAGVDEETARQAAQDEAVVSALIESADTYFDLMTLGTGTVLKNIFGEGLEQTIKSTAKKRLLKALGGYGLNIAGEMGEEGMQQAVSIANMNRDPNTAGGIAGVLDLTGKSMMTLEDAIIGRTEADRQNWNDIWGAAQEGGKIAAMMGGTNAAVNYTANEFMTRRRGSEVNAEGDVSVQQLIEMGLETEEGTESRQMAEQLKKQYEAGENLSNRSVGKLFNATAESVREGRVAKQEASEAASAPVSSADAELAKAAMEMAGVKTEEQETTQADAPVAAEAVAQKETSVKQLAEEFVGLATGYGEHGTKAVMAVMERERMTAPAAKRMVNTAYEAGYRGETLDTGKLNDVQTMAYEAGKLDAEAQVQKNKATAAASAVHKGGISLNHKDADQMYTMRLRNAQPKVYAAVDKLGKATGTKIIFDKSLRGKNSNGFYVSERGEIHISPDIQADKVVMEIVRHEVTHRMKDTAPKAYNEFRDYAVSMMGDGAVDRMIATYKEGNVQLDVEGAKDEIAAHYAEKILTDDKELGNFIEYGKKTADNRNVVQKFFDAIRSFIDKVKSLLHDDKASQDAAAMEQFGATIEELEHAEKLWKQALAESETTVKAKQNTTTKTEAKSAVSESDGLVTNAKGEPVAMIENDSHAQFSLKTYKEGGRYYLVDWLKKKVKSKAITQQDADDIVNQLDAFYDICKKYEGKYAPFGAWSNAEVVMNENGNPVFSVVKKNGEYAMNLDFSLVCKKRRTLDAVFSEMIERGMIDSTTLTEEDIVKINDIIRDNGFETACALCFVDSKRYRQAKVAESFEQKYNTVVNLLLPKDGSATAHRFNFMDLAHIKDSGKGIHTMSDAELKEGLDRVRAYMKQQDEGTVPWKIAKHILAHPEDRRLVSRAEFMNTKGFEAVHLKAPDIEKLYNSSKGSGGPKAAFSDVQYLGDILKRSNFKPANAYKVGGVRIQSFSDYVPRLVFDYLQMIGDLAAKKLPAHAYTKEALFAQQFGMTGIKVNMSLVPAIDPNGKAPGLDKDGNYLWKDGQSFGSDVQVKGSGQTGFELAVKIQNAKGYSANCGTIAVGVSHQHIRKMLDDPDIRMIIPYHKSSLNHIVAVMNNIDKYVDYTGVQNTRYKSDGTKITGKDFNYNEALRKHGDAKKAAAEYLAWCEKNKYLPKFDEFAKHPNYYKLLEDFSTYDNGVAAPQGAVTMTFPKKADAFGSMEELIVQGLEEDAVLEGRRDRDVPKIVDEIAAVLGGNQTFTEPDGTQIQYSLRTEAPPKKTMIGYKVFKVSKKHPGQLFPTKVANPSGQGTPVGVWLNADTGEIARNADGSIKTNTRGRISVKADGGTLAWRPGWHLGEMPEANQMNVENPNDPRSKNDKVLYGLQHDDYVFCECEFAADNDYQLDAFRYGTNDKGSYQHTQAGLPYIPKDGFYKYRTNANPNSSPWYISGSIRITKVLDDDMVREILAKNGYQWRPRKSGKDINLAEYGFTAGEVTPTEDLSHIAPGVDYSDEIRDLPGYKRNNLNWDNPNFIEAFNVQGIADKMDYYRELDAQESGRQLSLKSDAYDLERRINQLRTERAMVEEDLTFADDSEYKTLNNKLAKLNHEIDKLVAQERQAARRTSLQNILDNLHKYRRSDLESLAEQISDGNWDDYEDMTRRELEDGIREIIEGREYTPIEMQHPRFGYYVRDVSKWEDGTQHSIKTDTDFVKDSAERKAVNTALRRAYKNGEIVVMDKPSLQRMTKRMMDSVGSKASVKDMTERVTDLYEYIINGENGDKADFNTAYELAYAIATELAESAVAVEQDEYQTMKELRDEIRNTGITISKAYDHDLGGYESINEFRKAHFGKIKLVKDGTPVDKFYQLLAEQYPGYFNESEYTTQPEQLMHIAEVLEGLHPTEYNPYEGHTAEAASWFASDLLMRMYGMQNDRIADVIVRHKEAAAKTVKRESVKRAEAVKKVRTRYKDRELREKITRHTKALNQKLMRPSDKHHIPEEYRGLVLAVLESVNMESKDHKPTKRTQAFIDLKERYAKLSAEGDMIVDPDLLGDAETEVQGKFDKVIAMAETPIAEMSAEQLQVIWDVIRSLEHSISNAGKMLSEAKFERTSEWANAMLLDSATRRNRKGWDVEKFRIDLENPYTFFSHFGDAGMAIFRMLRNAQDRQQDMVSTIRTEVQSIVDRKRVKDWEKDVHKFTTERGDNLYLSAAHCMDIYLLMKREQAHDHLMKGGIVQPEIKADVAGKHMKIPHGTDAILLSEEDLSKIIGKLTDEQRQVADGLQKLTSTTLADYGNEASMKAYGYKKFTGKDYWTIKSSNIGIHSNVEKGGNNTRSIKNIGLAQSVVPHANNPLEIRGAFTTFATHAADMIDYAAWLCPMEDMNRLYNFRFRDDGAWTGKTIKGLLDRVGGKGSQQYWSRLAEDIQNGLNPTNDSELLAPINKVIGNVKGASVGANIRVIVQQPTAILRAAAVLNPVNMTKGLAKGATSGDGWKKALQYTAIAKRKEMGGFDISNSMQMGEILFDNKGSLQQFNEAMMTPAAKADALTWGRIWNACEWEIADNTDLRIGSDDFYEAVAAKFTEVIDQTQVVDGVLQRSQTMRSGNAIMKQATAFMGEPTMALNMMLRAFDAFTREQDPTKRSAALKVFGRTATALAVTTAFNALAQSLVDAWRDDDEEKDYWERFMAAFGENLKSGVNPFGYIPIAKDVISLLEGYKVTRADADVMSDIIYAVQNFNKSLSGEGKKTIFNASWNLLKQVSKVFGISASNIARDVHGIARTVAAETDNIGAQYAMEKAIYKLGNSDNRSRFVKLLWAAYEKGDMELYERITKDLIDNGITPSYIEEQIRKKAKAAGMSNSDLDEMAFYAGLKPVNTSTKETKEESFSIDNLGYDAYTTYRTTRSDIAEDILNDFRVHGYADLDEDTAYDLLKAAYDFAEAQAKAKVSGGKYEVTGWMADAVEAQKNGADIATYIMFDKGVDGMSKVEQLKFMDSMNLPQDEYNALLEAAFFTATDMKKIDKALTNSQYDDYAREFLGKYDQIETKLERSRSWNSYDDKAQEKMLGYAESFAREIALEQLSGGKYNSTTEFGYVSVDDVLRGLDNGLTTDEIFEGIYQKNTLPGVKDANGNTVRNSVKKQFIAWMQSKGYSHTKQKALLSAVGYDTKGF